VSRSIYLFLGPLILLFFLVACKKESKQDDYSQLTASQRDSVYTGILFGHLRANFDDIHDVSMRFHHLDHTLNGLIVLKLDWENGKIQSAGIAENETGNEDFADAIIEKLNNWYIADLQQPFHIALPLRIKIVGSDDPSFNSKSIFTGEVLDNNGDVVQRAKISFVSAENAADTVASCYTNREGIFVRTLIPPGLWDISCSCPGYKKIVIKNVNFIAAEHHRQKIILSKQ